MDSERHEDPAVAEVERVFDAAATRLTQAGGDGRRVEAERAVWLCACETQHDAPTWLVLEGANGLAWMRVDDGVEPSDLLRTPRLSGEHLDPGQLLAWLRGEAPHPVSGHYGATTARVLGEVRRRARPDLRR